MEPVTLIAVTLGAAVATARPKWDSSTTWQQPMPVVHCHTTNNPNWVLSVVNTEQLIAPSIILPIADARDYILATIQKYSTLPDDWNGEGASAPTLKSLESAEYFLSAIPAGFALPKPMLSTVGNIEYYWSAEQAYADISFDENGIASLFLKLTGFPDKLVSDIKEQDINAEWFMKNLAFFSSIDTDLMDSRFEIAA